MKRLAGIAALLLCAQAAHAQIGSINWSTNVEQGVALAKRNNVPIMFYVLSGSDDRDNDIERDHRASFADPRVFELSKKFVTLHMSRSRYRDQLTQWGLPFSSNMIIVFTKPDGTMIDTLSVGGVAQPQSLAQKMALVFNKFRTDLFENEIKPVLTADPLNEGDVRKGLKIIDAYTILAADQDLIAFLERDGVSPALKLDVYESLALLSTPASLKALLTAAEEDPKVAKLLEKCTPDAADRMLEQMTLENPKPAMFFAVYNAVTKICRVKSPKPERFWSGPNANLKTEELERVREIVRETARRWRDVYADYR